MGVVNTKSSVITNADATPVVLNNPAIAGSKAFVAVGTLEVAATDSGGSVYRFARIPSNAVIHSIKLWNDDLDTGTAVTFDVGLHQTAGNGGAAADANVYGTDIATCQAAAAATELRYETLDINTVEKRVWENLALSADSQREYDLTMTLGGTLTNLAAGTMTIVMVYSVA